MESSYLITGGFGLIGSKLANVLKGKITILSRSTNHRQRVKNPNVKILIKNLNEITPKDVKDIDIIYHCASTVDNYNILSDPFIDAETNINGTIYLLEKCKKLSKKPKIIFPSTFFVYGNEYERTHSPVTEESKTDPLALYPATKLCAESIIKLYSRLYDIPYLICRLTNVYGEEEDYTNKKKGALNYLTMLAIKGKTLPIYNAGKFYRDYIFVDDVIDALMLLEKTGKTNDIYLIGYGEPVLFRDIIDYLLENTGFRSKIEEIELPSFHRVVGITNFVGNTSKIKTLGWKPKIDYREGMKRIVNKYKSLIKQ